MWPSRFSRAMNCHSVWRSSTSTPAVGSSSTITGGRCTSACATSTRRFMPPESWRMLASALSARPRLVQQLVDPGVVVAHAEVAALDAQRLAHAEERIEHQLLRHDAERAARLRVVGSTTSCPSTVTRPPLARARPARMLISVVLPAPLGPSRPKNSPGSMSKLTSSSARNVAAMARVGLGDLLERDGGHRSGDCRQHASLRLGVASMRAAQRWC